jgi:glutamine synthetase
MKYRLEYIWIGGKQEFRSKTKILDLDHTLIFADLPIWNFDGSSTNQSDSEDTEVMLRPVKYVRDPLSRMNSYLVLCETYSKANPISDREKAKQIFDTRLDLDPWFGLEQEYIMLGQSIPNDTQTQGAYYCGVGHGKHPLERQIAMEHMEACLDADLDISGINAEVAHCQWEYQIGPSVGIDAGDQLLLSRYILERIAEKYGVSISYDPKPFPHINGSGCHVNFSTEEMREENGLQAIEEAIRKLGNHHEDIIAISGENNHMRLTGHHETSSMYTFSWGVGTRHTSVRIPNEVFTSKQGYFEDRRCAANVNPYVVTSTLFDLCK